MKLTYNKHSKDPIYYIQEGVRNGKKSTTRTISRIGKHSELLAITDDPLAYAKNMVAEYNRKQKSEKIADVLEIKVRFNEKVTASPEASSPSAVCNIGWLFLQAACRQLNLKQFFVQTTPGYKLQYDPYETFLYLVCRQILDPSIEFYGLPRADETAIQETQSLLPDHFDTYMEFLSNAIRSDCSISGSDSSEHFISLPDLIFRKSEDSNCLSQKKDKARYAVSSTALLISRILEVRLNASPGAEQYSTENIKDTLNHLNIVNMQDLYYTAAYQGSKTLHALCAVYDLKLDHRNYRPKDLHRILKEIQ